MTEKKQKKLSKKQIIWIIVAAVALVAAVTVSVAVPLALRNKDAVPTISFARFDRLSDYSVTVTWNKIRGTKKYTVEFCYGKVEEGNIRKLTTESNVATIERQTGILSVRVKADDKSFSEWASIDIPALKLKTPTKVVFSTENCKASWTEVYYDFYGTRTPVSVYSYDYGFDGDYVTIGFTASSGTESESLAAIIKVYVYSIYEEGTTPWEDFTFSVRVKATARPKFSASETDREAYLNKAYVESDYNEATVTITKEIYDRIKSL